MRRGVSVAAGVVMLLIAAASAAAGQVRGTVTPVAIAPEVEVCLVEASPSETCSSPQASGNYTLTGLPAGTPLKIEFIPSYRSHYAVQYYEGASTASTATVIFLPPTAPIQEGVDAALDLGGVIEGTVRANMSPLPEVEVCALEASTGESDGCTHSDESGLYRLAGLPPGFYKVSFRGDGASADFAPQYYGGADTVAQATAIELSASSTVSGVDAALIEGASVRGTVSKEIGGTTLGDVPVCIFATLQAAAYRCTFTNDGGTFSLVGIPPGGYQIGFSLSSAEIEGEAGTSGDDGYIAQYYDEVPDRGGAVILTLGAGEELVGIDGRLSVPAAPAPAVVPAAPSNPLTPAPIRIVEPQPGSKKVRCRRGYRHRKVKGASRCVKKKVRCRRGHRHRKVKGASHCVKKKRQTPKHKRKVGGRRGPRDRSVGESAG